VTPLEAAVRAVCRHIGTDPEGWEHFAEIGRVALGALLEALPPDLAKAIRAELGA
jgi:hypothetical protein